MLNRKLLTATAAIVLALTLGYGLLQLFAIRWERGDVYPPYSTLRADPLGTRILFESVAALPGMEVRRNYRPLQQLRPDAPVTLIYAGVSQKAQWGNDELRHLETLLASGSRAVFAFSATDLEREIQSKKPEAEPKEDEAPTPEPEKTTPKREEESREKDQVEELEEGAGRRGADAIPFREVAERWGFKFDVAKAKRAGSFHGVASAAEAGSGLEQELSWHSAMRFTELEPPWQVLYRAAGEPVVIERRWGDGTIVLAADSFFLSNEALMNERSARLLAWLIATPQTLIFDEEHLGVAEDIGLIALARKYRLQGAMAALALVAMLWIWRQAVRFVPAHSTARQSEEYVAGLDSQAGFISLLRRSVPPSKALEVCVEEWRKTFSHDKKALATVERALADFTPADTRKADPAVIYQAVARALKANKNRKA